MFKFELGQVVEVSISGEEGHVKGRAEYANMNDHYYIHYLTADGRGVDGWFDEGEISSAVRKDTTIGADGEVVNPAYL